MMGAVVWGLVIVPKHIYYFLVSYLTGRHPDGLEKSLTRKKKILHFSPKIHMVGMAIYC